MSTTATIDEEVELEEAEEVEAELEPELEEPEAEEPETDPRPRVWLAGPMTGRPLKRAKEDFERAAERLADFGVRSSYGILDVGVNHDRDYEQVNGDLTRGWFRQNLPLIATADAVVLLPGWWYSRGANAEIMAASLAGIPRGELLLEGDYPIRWVPDLASDNMFVYELASRPVEVPSWP